MIVRLRSFSLLLEIPSNLHPYFFLADLLEERVHVIALGIVEDEREEEPPALPLEVAFIAGRTKILTC